MTIWSVELLNYRKNGTPFWNALHLGPIYNDAGEIVYFFGSQWDVSDVRAARAEEEHAKNLARELSHRMKNVFAVISGIVNVTGRVRNIREEAAEINDRIQTLGLAYETTLDDTTSGSSNVADAIRAVLSPFDDQDHERLELRGENARTRFGLISIIGLVLHELAANATKYGAWSQSGGVVQVDWSLSEDQDTFNLSWSERGGPPVDPSAITPGSGTTIVDRLLAAAGGGITRKFAKTGFEATISVSGAKR